MGKPYSVIKKLLDVSLAVFGIFVCAPIFILLYYIIRLDSKGPVIFTQDRVGIQGRVFKMYKFRTMVNEAEKIKYKYRHLNEAKHHLFKIKNDPRLTRIGNLLRNSNLDELPQLFNVLKGEMSLVGPRPFLCKEVAEFAPWQKQRLECRPGMTSPWYCYGYNLLSTDFAEWVRSDIEYIKNINFMLDMKLILKSLYLVFFHLRKILLTQ